MAADDRRPVADRPSASAVTGHGGRHGDGARPSGRDRRWRARRLAGHGGRSADGDVDRSIRHRRGELKRRFEGGRPASMLLGAAGDHGRRRRPSTAPAAGDRRRRGRAPCSMRRRRPAVGHLVVLSTAMVYGAWANNPVPLTEAAAIRPEPGRRLRRRRPAEIERLVVEWRDDHPSATATVLRPVVTVAAGDGGWLKRSPWVPDPWRAGVGRRRSARAVPARSTISRRPSSSACRHRLDGPFNVAPEGWISRRGPLRSWSGPARASAAGRGGRALTGAPAAARRLPRRRSRPTRASRGWWPAIALRAAGWAPADTNEQAFVEADTRRARSRRWTPAAARRCRSAAVGVVVAAAGRRRRSSLRPPARRRSTAPERRRGRSAAGVAGDERGVGVLALAVAQVLQRHVVGRAGAGAGRSGGRPTR